jgi:hypothetical protein
MLQRVGGQVVEVVVREAKLIVGHCCSICQSQSQSQCQ